VYVCVFNVRARAGACDCAIVRVRARTRVRIYAPQEATDALDAFAQRCGAPLPRAAQPQPQR
jgi:hypothetical protein